MTTEHVQGYIAAKGKVCFYCLPKPEDQYTLPWLFAGEAYTCSKCGKHYRVPEEEE